MHSGLIAQRACGCARRNSCSTSISPKTASPRCRPNEVALASARRASRDKGRPSSNATLASIAPRRRRDPARKRLARVTSHPPRAGRQSGCRRTGTRRRSEATSTTPNAAKGRTVSQGDRSPAAAQIAVHQGRGEQQCRADAGPPAEAPSAAQMPDSQRARGRSSTRLLWRGRLRSRRTRIVDKKLTLNRVS